MNRREFAGSGSKDIIRIIRVGDDDNSATTEDIESVMKYVEEHKKFLVPGTCGSGMEN